MTGDVTVYARWTAVSAKTVTFKVNYVAADGLDDSHDKSETVTLQVGAALPSVSYDYIESRGYFTDQAMTTAFSGDKVTEDMPELWIKLDRKLTITEGSYVFTLREDNTTYAIAENAANKPSAAEVTLPLKVGPYDVTAVARRGFISSSFTKLTIPEGYTDIVENAFYGNTSLVVVNFPSTLKAIDANAFLDASSLTVVWFAEGLETIGINAFSGTNLPFVILPASLKLIESGAFDIPSPTDDKVLEEVLFMGSVAPQIEKGAFGNERRDYLCARDALDAYKTALTVSETGGSLYEFDDTRLDFQGRYTAAEGERFGIEFWMSGSWKGVVETVDSFEIVELSSYDLFYYIGGAVEERRAALIENDTFTFKMYGADTTYIGEAAFMGAVALEGFTVPAGVSIVGDYAFCFSGVRTVDMSAADEITVLPEYIFGENTRLATISLPENLVTIEGYAFYMASALKNIVIPDSVTTIGEYAFYACTSLESVSLPANLKTLGASAFSRCLSLEGMEIDQSNKDFVTYDGILYSSDYELAYVVPAGIVGPVRMPEAVTIIPGGFFSECKNLKGVIFHDGINAIGDSAFAYCTGLETMTIGKNVTNIMENAFAYAGNKDTVINFETGSKYAYVKKDAFYRLTAKEINLPASAVTFDGEAFRMCEAEVKFHEDTTLTTVVADMFKDYLGTSIELPASVTTIGARAFMDALNLETIEFDATKITSVGFDAFRNTKWYNSQPDGIVVLSGLAYEIKGARNTLTSVTLPADTVVLAGSLFNGCSNLTTLVLNEGLLAISGSAFANCVNLTELVIPKTVTSIGAQAFNNMSATIVFATDGSLTHLGDQAFYGYKGKTLNIPAYVETLGASVFYQFEGEIIFDDDSAITEIGASAFATYYGRELTLPAGVTTIKSSAFSGAIHLTELALPAGLKTIEANAFTGMNSIKTLTIPASVETLREKAFTGFNGSYITFEGTTPPQVLNVSGETSTNIGVRGGTSTNGHVIVLVPSSALEAYRAAFNDKTEAGEGVEPALTDELVYSTIDESDNDFVIIDIEDNGKKLIAYAGDAVDKIEIPNGVTEIGPAALSQGNGTKFKADGLNWVVVPATVQTIHGNGLSGVRVVEFLGDKMPTKGSEGIGQWASTNKVSVVIVPDGAYDTFVNDKTNFGTIKRNVIEKSEINSDGFAISNGELKAVLNSAADITVPANVTKIADKAFYGLSSMETVTFLGNVTSIGVDAFRECINLKSITLPASVTEIGTYAFGNCRSLEQIVLPENLVTLGNNAFNECVSLTRVTFNSKLESIGTNAFAKSALSGALVLPSSLTSLGDGAFNSTLIESVTLPDSLVTHTYNYANGAFGMCYRLKTVSLGGLTSIPQYMFQYCTSLESIDLTDITDIGPDAFNNCVSLNELVLPEGLKTIGDRAFIQCHSLVSVTTPESLVSIGVSAFGAQGSSGNYPTSYTQCRNLKSVHIKGAPTIGDMAFFYCPIETLVIDGWKKGTTSTSNGTNAFAAAAITSVTLGEGVEYIGMAAFERSPVESIVLPSSLVEIASYAFRRTTALESLTFVDPATSKLTTIGAYAFDSSALKSFAMPDNYKKVNAQIFYYSNIEEITLGANTTQIENNAFIGSKIKSIFLPKTLTHVGGGIFNNCVNLETVYVEATEEEVTAMLVASVDYTSETPQWHQQWTDGIPDGAEIVYGYAPEQDETENA